MAPPRRIYGSCARKAEISPIKVPSLLKLKSSNTLPTPKPGVNTNGITAKRYVFMFLSHSKMTPCHSPVVSAVHHTAQSLPVESLQQMDSCSLPCIEESRLVTQTSPRVREGYINAIWCYYLRFRPVYKVWCHPCKLELESDSDNHLHDALRILFSVPGAAPSKSHFHLPVLSHRHWVLTRTAVGMDGTETFTSL